MKLLASGKKLKWKAEANQVIVTLLQQLFSKSTPALTIPFSRKQCCKRRKK